MPYKQIQRTAAAFCFALETGMRAGEIVALTAENVFWERRFVHLPHTKNGLARDVPLSPHALEILKQVSLAHDNKRIFGISSTNLDALFRKLKKQIGIENLHFHDTRREALMRLAKIYSPLELAKIRGHKDLRILLNIYYAPTAEELAEKMC